MGSVSSIEWTDATWNPVRARGDGKLGWHCERVSPGCERCYAERLNGRLGTGLKYTVPNRQHVELFLDEKILTAPLRWRKPRKIFLGSMTDVFGGFVPDEWIDRIFAVMALAPQHAFQVLTKRATRMRKYLAGIGLLVMDTRKDRVEETIAFEAEPWQARPLSGWAWNDPQTSEGRVELAGYYEGVSILWPLPNVWLGVSAEDQQRLDERVPELLATPAAVRFVSAEPLLGPITFGRGVLGCTGHLAETFGNSLIHWVIIGGESGPGARPMDTAWALDIVRQCAEAGTTCFVKQMGAYWAQVYAARRIQGTSIRLKRDRKGGATEEWPPDLRVREFPEVRP